MSDNNMVIAVYNTHRGAEDAVQGLIKSEAERKVDMKKVSMAAKGYLSQEEVVAFYNLGDGMKHCGKYGSFWSGIWNLLGNAAFFAVPGVGPVLAAGPIVGWMVDALNLSPSKGVLSVIGESLARLGLPHDSVVKYELGLKNGKFLLGVNGTAEEVDRARYILRGTEPASLDMHSNLITERALAIA